MADLEDYAAAVEAQSATRASIATAAAAAVGAQWREFGDWYSTRAIGALVREQLASLSASKRQVANSTNAYLSRVSTFAAGRTIRPARLVDVNRARRDGFTGQPMDTNALLHALGRPADLFRYESAQGLDEVDVIEHVVERAERIVEAEHDLVMREQSRQFVTESRRIAKYRRVIRPELSAKTGVCGLCVVAADRLYFAADLLPIHDGCNCEVLPIVDGVDPGNTLNGDDLRNLYDVAGTNYAEGLRAVRIKVASHGELGPWLAEASEELRTAREARAATSPRRRPRPDGQTA